MCCSFIVAGFGQERTVDGHMEGGHEGDAFEKVIVIVCNRAIAFQPPISGPLTGWGESFYSHLLFSYVFSKPIHLPPH